MWPNKTPTHPCHSLQILRGSIKPLLHSNFERYSCPTLKYPTLFKNWKIEAIRNSFNFHMPSSISLNSCNMNQHLLLLLSSHFTLFPIAKSGGESAFQDQLVLLFSDATQEMSVTSPSLVCCFGNYSLPPHHHPSIPLLSWTFRLFLLT